MSEKMLAGKTANAAGEGVGGDWLNVLRNAFWFCFMLHFVFKEFGLTFEEFFEGQIGCELEMVCANLVIDCDLKRRKRVNQSSASNLLF